MRKFVRDDATAYNIMMFDFADRADNCLCSPWRFPIMGSDKLVTTLSAYTRWMVYG